MAGIVAAAFLVAALPMRGGAEAAETAILPGEAENAVPARLEGPWSPNQLFRQPGTDKGASFADIESTRTFEVLNPGKSFVMVMFEPGTNATLSPRVVRLRPWARQAVTLSVRPGVRSFNLEYAVAQASAPFVTHTNSYRAYSDGETVLCVPAPAALCAAMGVRTESILRDSKVLVTDAGMPSGTYVYTPGPFYKAAGLFARDFLYQLEGAGRDTVTTDEVKRAVDYLARKQLGANKKCGAFTYPKGAIPDHVYPDGRYCWGPGAFYGDNTAHFNRPSMDESFCFITLAWHYGYKAGWDASWRTWFKENKQRFAEAWQSAPRNPATGLITQWTTGGHVGAQGVAETNGACVMWGFHDSYGFPGDDLGTSVLACNAARALADMHQQAEEPREAREWSGAAFLMQEAIRAQFNPKGYLPWGVGKGAPTMASPDITGYAVWSGILSDAQADAASDWLAARYEADKKAGGAADLFHMTPGLRGAIRMARKAEDAHPGSHVWPHVPPGHWENLAYGYNAYQDGGYWYYMSLGVAATLQRRHPAMAREWVTAAYTDITSGDANHPYERIDGVKPVNDRYNASVGPLLGMGMPAAVRSISVTVNLERP